LLQTPVPITKETRPNSSSSGFWKAENIGPVYFGPQPSDIHHSWWHLLSFIEDTVWSGLCPNVSTCHQRQVHIFIMSTSCLSTACF